MSTLRFELQLLNTRFIETGMYAGDTMAQMIAHPFKQLDGIEIAPEWVKHCKERFAADPRVAVHTGSSPNVLRQILSDVPTTFWLDAHFTGDPLRPHLMDQSVGECPLLEELAVIIAFPWTTPPIIVIDDVHMYTPAFWETEGAKHFRRDRWPSLKEVLRAMPGYRKRISAGILYAFVR